MRYRQIGRTGITVSALSIGTVSMGLSYGIRTPEQCRCPDKVLSMRLLEAAADRGITLFDTAPTYGDAEEILGRALGRKTDCLFATKSSIHANPDAAETLRVSVENSLKRLRRGHIDILQLHNADSESIENTEISEVMHRLKNEGKVRVVGVSVYGEMPARTALKSDIYETIQIAYNLLDRAVPEPLIAEAYRLNKGILARSVLLKGVLTEKVGWIPPSLSGLRNEANRFREAVSCSWQGLPAVALRFVLSNRAVSSALLGPQSLIELEAAVKAEAEGPLAKSVLDQLPPTHVEPWLLNPSNWVEL